MKHKIIQIIPNNNTNLKTEHKFTKDNQTDYFYMEVIGYALVELEDGQREVKPLTIDDAGEVGLLEDLAIGNDDGFVGMANNYYK